MSAHSYIIRSYNPFVVEYHDFNSHSIKLERYKYPLTHAEIRAEMPFVSFNEDNDTVTQYNESFEERDYLDWSDL